MARSGSTRILLLWLGNQGFEGIAWNVQSRFLWSKLQSFVTALQRMTMESRKEMGMVWLVHI